MVTPSPAGRWRDTVLLVAFFASGCAALGYELLWTRLLGLALGHEMLGVLGTLAGFFAGMAAGSAVLHTRVLRSMNPIVLFAALEVVAAVYAAASPHFLHALAELVPAATFGQTGGGMLASALAVATIALLPGTFCLGATLPALVEAHRRVWSDAPAGRSVGRLYAINTAGATAGVLLSVHVVFPAVGLGTGALVFASIGLGAAGLALRWARKHRVPPQSPPPDETPAVDCSRDPDPEVLNERWLLLALALGTGLVGVGLEVVGVQVLSEILENTVYTFADVLAVYLVGTAVGAALYARYIERALNGRPAVVAAAGLIALGVAAIQATLALSVSDDLMLAMAPDTASLTQHLLAEMVVAAAVFAIPTVLMGMLFAHIVGLVAPAGIGRVYAMNTLGSALAPAVFALWVIPSSGYRDAAFVVVYAYLFLFGGFTWFRRFRTVWQIGPILAVVALTALGPSSLVLVEPGPGSTTLEVRETPMGLVIVSESTPQRGPKLRRLQVGRHFRMGGAKAFGERRMGQLPLVLHPSAERALYLGVGTGATLGAVTTSKLRHVDAVELVPAVLEMLEHFDAINGRVRDDARVSFHAADARRFLAASPDTYDVIVADLFHPGRDGAGSLYSREHFVHAREHLAPDGLFAQWVPLYQLDDATLRTIIRTFLAVFPEAHSWLGIYNPQTPAMVLVGRAPPDGSPGLRVELETLRARLSEPVFVELVMEDPRDLMAAYLLDRDGLVAFASEGPLNTDLHPRVLFDAPRAAYTASKSRGWDNLSAVLAQRTGPPEAIVGSGDEAELAAFTGDVARFAEALSHYLHGEADRLLSDDQTVPSFAAVDHILAAYDVAPEFRPAQQWLFATARSEPEFAARIYPPMLERSPGDQRIYQAYLVHLRRVGDEARFDEIRSEAATRFGPPQALDP